MSIISRFFGKKETAFERGLIANPDNKKSLGLQVLFTQGFKLTGADLESKFKSYQPDFSRVQVELDEELDVDKTLFGMIGWDDHVIQMIGFDLPMPAESVEVCVAPSHYDEGLKNAARSHQCHVLLYYKGYNPDPIAQYASLALVAGFLSNYGAVVVVNEAAHTSFPASALVVKKSSGNAMEVLQTLPLPVLYCGFVKYDVEGVNGVWMRTYGAPLLDLPDMASLARDHSAGQQTFDIFSNVFSYLLNSGARFSAGNTMQMGDDLFMKLRLPSEEEYYLQGDGELFVAEFITAAEANPV